LEKVHISKTSDTEKREEGDKNQSDVNIGEIFNTMTNSLSLYEIFVSNFPNSVQTRKQCSQFTEFTQFLTECHKQAGESLDDLLKMVYCHIPLLLALLRHLLEATEPTHLDKNTLALAVRKLESLTNTLKQHKTTDKINPDWNLIADLSSSFTKKVVLICLLVYQNWSCVFFLHFYINYIGAYAQTTTYVGGVSICWKPGSGHTVNGATDVFAGTAEGVLHVGVTVIRCRLLSGSESLASSSWRLLRPDDAPSSRRSLFLQSPR